MLRTKSSMFYNPILYSKNVKPHTLSATTRFLHESLVIILSWRARSPNFSNNGFALRTTLNLFTLLGTQLFKATKYDSKSSIHNYNNEATCKKIISKLISFEVF